MNCDFCLDDVLNKTRHIQCETHKLCDNINSSTKLMSNSLTNKGSALVSKLILYLKVVLVHRKKPNRVTENENIRKKNILWIEDIS